MKILQINLGLFGSTGGIMLGIENVGKEKHDFCKLYPKLENNFAAGENDIQITGVINRKFNHFIEQISGFQGCFSFIKTYQTLKKIKRFAPDMIQIHSLHSVNVNLSLLFNYIKKHNLPVVWTLHDCWSFTGHCPYFDMIGCDKWKTGCHDCPQYKEYPRSFVDNSRYMYKLKKKWFTGIENMTIVTPSNWLAELVKESFLKDYPVKVIHNGIDLSIFQPTQSNFREKYAIGDKYIVLGVAFGWGKRKGLDVFVDLAQRLDSEKYQIVLVGTDDSVDKQLPDNIISIHRTQNQTELAEIYTAADVFANPTREDNYPTVNMESIACGTPVLTFKTGGSPEMLDATCGSVVPKDDVDAMEREIVRICETKPYSIEACLERAKSFDKDEKFQEYVELYEVINEQK